MVPLAAAIRSMCNLGAQLTASWNQLYVVFFGERDKPENPEKNPQSREENQHKLNPLMASGPGIEHGPHWREASALTTTPSLLHLKLIEVMHLSVSSPRGGGSGIGWVFWHFLEKKIKIPTPGRKKILSKLAETNGLLPFYYIKLKDQMHDVRSKSPPWGYMSQSNSRGLPDPPPPSGLTLMVHYNL